jgi:hypothetical protein
MMKNQLFTMAALNLLDDSALVTNDFAWQQITRTELAAAAALKKAQSQPPQKAEAPLPAPRENKFFSSSPTLRQMMNDYNRSYSRLSGFKSKPSEPARPQHGKYAEFRYDRVDYIEIPNIPGRVLRPSK